MKNIDTFDMLIFRNITTFDYYWTRFAPLRLFWHPRNMLPDAVNETNRRTCIYMYILTTYVSQSHGIDWCVLGLPASSRT